MDKEYRSKVQKSLIDGLYGTMIGIPVSLKHALPKILHIAL